jgi:hypothetical protein
MKRPVIKDCYFRSKEGKCCSPEIDRFLEDMDTGKPCPINPEFTAFYDDGTSHANELRCHEFRPRDPE